MNERAKPENLATLENSPFFMPFSMNRAFKKAPRLLARAEGMYYYTPEGRKILDGTSGLWCVNAGPLHGLDDGLAAVAGVDAPQA